MNSVLRKVFIATIAGLVAFAPFAVSATEHVVQIIGISFVPQSITVNQGDTIRWTNYSGLYHTSTSGTSCTPDGIWSIEIPDQTEQTLAMNTVGTFPYFCIPHCAALMTGTVIVEAPVGIQTSTWGKIKALYSSGR